MVAVCVVSGKNKGLCYDSLPLFMRVIPDTIGRKFQEVYEMKKTLQKCSLSVADENTKGIDCASEKAGIEFADNTVGECFVNVMLKDKEHHNFHLHHPSHRVPCFRYDARGHTHVNPMRISRELTKRVVPCPHFHKFTVDGFEYAYRTPIIDKEEAALKDIQNSFHAFCHEGKITCSAEEIPTLELSSSLFPKSDLDPLEGHKFP